MLLVRASATSAASRAVPGTPGPLVDQLDQLLAGATLSQAAKDRVIAALNAVPGSTSDLERVRAAVYLIMTTAGGAVQK